MRAVETVGQQWSRLNIPEDPTRSTKEAERGSAGIIRMND